MRTMTGNSPRAAFCVFLLLLCAAVKSPATETVEARKRVNEDLSTYAGADLSQSVPTDQTIGPEASITTPPDSSHRLAELISRIRSNASLSHSDEERGRPLALDVWSSHVQVPETKDEAKGRLALQSLIEQLRSVKFEDKTLASALTPPAEPQPTPTSPSEPADSQRVKSQETPRMVRAAPESVLPLSAKAQKTLETLQQNPDQAKEPLPMAELLFLSGRTTEAIPFYQKALEQNHPDDPTSAADRAWILFQLGNCLRDSDMAKAQEMYGKLIAEHPQSPWTELARAHGQLLAWHQQDRPRELVASRQP